MVLVDALRRLIVRAPSASAGTRLPPPARRIPGKSRSQEHDGPHPLPAPPVPPPPGRALRAPP